MFHTGCPTGTAVSISCSLPSSPNFTLLYFSNLINFWSLSHPNQKAGSHLLFYPLLAQSCPTLCDPMNCSPPGSNLFKGFSRQEYWSGLPFPSPGDLPDPGIEPSLLHWQADSLLSEPPRKPLFYLHISPITKPCWLCLLHVTPSSLYHITAFIQPLILV